MEKLTVVPFQMVFYEAVIALWQRYEGVGLSSADSRESIQFYLARNPGMSFVALYDAQIVGAILCGHDGRRGYIHHLAVDPQHRRKGIGRSLVDNCMQALQEIGIQKCHLFIFHENDNGRAFWEGIGWTWRQDIRVMSHYVG